MTLPPPAPESIALVTGASSEIGEQYARQLCDRGYRVALVARREERLAKLSEELGGPDRAVVIPAGLAVAEDRDRLAARLEELGQRVEILVNNARYGIRQGPADDQPTEGRQHVDGDREEGRTVRARSGGGSRWPPDAP